jgi:TolA-binding protein
MRRRLTRHDMVRQDEFITGVASAAAWVERRRRLFLFGGGAALGVVLVVAGAIWLVRSRGAAADAALGEAMQLMQAPIVPPGQTAPAGAAKTFARPGDRDTEVLARLEGVVADHPMSRAATIAAYFRGTTLLSLGRAGEARDALTSFARDYASSPLVPLARQALARAETAAGNAAGAVEICRALVEQPSPLMPGDSALMGLARAQEAAGQVKEAGQTYQRVLTEYPQSAYAAEATHAVSRLRPAAPVPAA